MEAKWISDRLQILCTFSVRPLNQPPIRKEAIPTAFYPYCLSERLLKEQVQATDYTEASSPSGAGTVVTSLTATSTTERLSRTERMNRAVFYPFQNTQMRHLHNGCARHPSRKSAVFPLFTPFCRVKHEDRLDIQAREIELRILRNHQYTR